MFTLFFFSVSHFLRIMEVVENNNLLNLQDVGHEAVVTLFKFREEQFLNILKDQ